MDLATPIAGKRLPGQRLIVVVAQILLFYISGEDDINKLFTSLVR